MAVKNYHVAYPGVVTNADAFTVQDAAVMNSCVVADFQISNINIGIPPDTSAVPDCDVFAVGSKLHSGMKNGRGCDLNATH